MSFPSNYTDGSALAPLSAEIEYKKFTASPESFLVDVQSKLSQEDYAEYIVGLTEVCQKLRSSEYPPMEEYLDAVVKNDDLQKQTYIDTCLAIKAKYPKPEDNN